MNKILLEGKTKLSFWDGKAKNPKVTEIPAQIPGNVEIDMMNADILPDIYFGENIKLLRDYEMYNYKYEIVFHAVAPKSDERVFLHFEGVDCIAEYFLNGKAFGKSKNALIDHRFDVTELLKDGENILEVAITSPIIYAEGLDYGAYEWAYYMNYEALRVRKAPHSYGWDITPRLFGCGIWREIYIEYEQPNEIFELYMTNRNFFDGMAQIMCVFDTKIDKPNYKDVYLKLTGAVDGKNEFEYTHKVRFCKGNFSFDLKEPKLWWPAGYGKANVYDITAELISDGVVVATYHTVMGIRTIKLIKSEYEDMHQGEFVFLVNGEKIMCHGTNWVPLDALHSKDAKRYDKALPLMTDLGCNMVRCWGGNVYEDHKFFDYCDRNGIMVWQDFAMACAFYPQDQEFLGEMAAEAAAVVKKLRKHPSIALWSGDNECDVHYSSISKMAIDPNKNKITREVLPEAIRKYAPYSEYLPSSPYLSPTVLKKTLERTREQTPIRKRYPGELYKCIVPEDHPWGPRDYFKSDYYTSLDCSFFSETGTVGCPNLSTLKTFISEDKLWPWDNAQWFAHTTADSKNDGYAYHVTLFEDGIKEFFGDVPDNIEDFILASQINQAESFKYMIERVRMEKWRTTGILWWNVINSWPQFDNSVVTYDFAKKLAYYYIKRSQEPVMLAMSGPSSWVCYLTACNDTLEEKKISYKVWDADTKEVMRAGDAVIEKNMSVNIDHFPCYHGERRLFIIEWQCDGKTYYNHYLAGYPPFDLDKYREWLKLIGELDGAFDADKIGK